MYINEDLDRVYMDVGYNIKKDANRSNSTFGFLPIHKPTLKKTKRAVFLPTLETRKKHN
jgi:hypothetical protein